MILWWWYVGWPSPRLTWWQDNDMVDDSMDQPRDNRVSNTLTIQRVSRDLLDSRIECRASSTPLLDPVVIFLSLDILRECPILLLAGILNSGMMCSSSTSREDFRRILWENDLWYIYWENVHSFWNHECLCSIPLFQNWVKYYCC